jgi:hypothetical protein
VATVEEFILFAVEGLPMVFKVTTGVPLVINMPLQPTPTAAEDPVNVIVLTVLDLKVTEPKPVYTKKLAKAPVVDEDIVILEIVVEDIFALPAVTVTPENIPLIVVAPDVVFKIKLVMVLLLIDVVALAEAVTKTPTNLLAKAVLNVQAVPVAVLFEPPIVLELMV